MKNIYAILFIAFCFTLTACKKSVFVADPNNNLLPEYSESGRNIAGALLNDTAWRCEMYPCFACVPWRFYISSSLSGDSTTFMFNGLYTSNSIKFIDTSFYNIPTAFNFVIKGLKIENQDSLLKLNNRSFQLDISNSYCSISKFYPFNLDNKGPGTLIINKVQKGNWEFGDGSPNNPKIYRFVVSGHFAFKTTADRLYDVRDGRFDMEVYLNTNLGIAN
ncbi:hypothetical protein GALL_251680 [mine drainage metagenome]|uniref:Uncharacterized protein n=1 Tax=mine drainage metagenome TaxID=410659 RepID=A0A1J5RAN9_9ZZZZ